ncbi:MAG TPA: aminodeoxychorismate synthase component I [Permianibacter sp.]|nr:aminodeoxychorismate synthase component I [Permianibacter sp.]
MSRYPLASRYPQLLRELPYPGRTGVLGLFAPFADWAGAVLLDSGGHERGRFDLFSALPVRQLTTDGRLTRLHDHKGRLQGESPADPFALLDQALRETKPVLDEARARTLPFAGGLLMALSYDLGRRLETLPALARQDLPLADLHAGIYHWAVIVDHDSKTAGLWQFADLPDEQIARITATLAAPAVTRVGFALDSDWHSNLDREHYGRAFRQVQDYIHAGDCYQINLAQRFSARCHGDAYAAYCTLSPLNKAPFSSYWHTDRGQILSLSPERFVSVRDGVALTEPIKGTRPRHADPMRDQAEIDALKASEKDRAENLMIVDLLRNDFGKNCAIGSVKVPELFTIHSFPAVHHMISSVTGALAAGKTPLDLLRGCFPGGSITGAPKVRAMQIIEELEPHRRSLYCGSIGYCDYLGRLDSSITIRTLVHADHQIHCWAGGGLVADSMEQAEYEETFAKVSKLLPPLRG